MQMPTANTQEAHDELTGSMTIMYMLIQHALVYPEELDHLHSDLGMLSVLSKLPRNLCLDSHVGSMSRRLLC